jgi:hypothetical protein
VGTLQSKLNSGDKDGTLFKFKVTMHSWHCLLPIFCYQAMKKNSHLNLSEVCPNTKSHASTENHEMFGSTIRFHSL